MHQILFTIPLPVLRGILLALAALVPLTFIATALHGWVKYQQLDVISALIGIVIGVGIYVGRSYLTHELSVYAFGVMMVLGFFGALQLAKFLARHSGIDPELFVNAGLIALVTGVAGARLSHVLENISQYTDPKLNWAQNIWNAVNISSGGLTYYGGVVLAVPCTIAYGMYKRVPIRIGMDIVAPCLMVGLGFGRIGCFLNGCCYGAECDNVPWQVSYPYYSNPYIEQVQDRKIQIPLELRDEDAPGIIPAKSPVEISKIANLERRKHLEAVEATTLSRPLHPAQLYSTLTAWLIALFLVAYYTLPHAPGRGFALMLIVEPIARYLLEMLRAEPAFIGRGGKHFTFAWLPPQSFSMTLSFLLIPVGFALWYAFRGPKVIPGTQKEIARPFGHVAISGA